jgi:hypothetical protein
MPWRHHQIPIAITDDCGERNGAMIRIVSAG